MHLTKSVSHRCMHLVARFHLSSVCSATLAPRSIPAAPAQSQRQIHLPRDEVEITWSPSEDSSTTSSILTTISTTRSSGLTTHSLILLGFSLGPARQAFTSSSAAPLKTLSCPSRRRSIPATRAHTDTPPSPPPRQTLVVVSVVVSFCRVGKPCL